MIRKLTRWQAFGLAMILVACALAVTGAVCHAETLQCWPAHTPFKSDAMSQDSALFGLICCIGAILFLW